MKNNILIHQGLDIANSYIIQLEEDKLKKNGKLKRQIYFDASDVIQLIQGSYSVTQASPISLRKEIFEDPVSLVLALIYNNPDELIHLLPPHQDELIDKLTNKDTHLFPGFYIYDKKDFAKEIFNTFGLNDLVKDNPNKAIRKYTAELKRNAKNLFKLNYMLNHFYWTDRYKYLFGFEKDSDKRIIIDNDDYAIKKIVNTPLFKTLLKAFDEEREAYKKNNIIDAMSFYLLQDKLDAYKRNPRENPLPIFYVSKKVTYKALKKVIKENDKWFTYKSKELTIPIIRDSDFFILDFIFSLNNNIDDLDQVLRKVKDIKDILRLEYDNYKVIERVFGKDEYDKFSQRIDEIVSVEFFVKVWLEEKNYKNFSNLIKEHINYTDDVNKNVIKRIMIEKKEIEKNIKSSLQKENYGKLNLFKSAVEKLEKVGDFISERGLKPDEDIDIFNEFALIRFSLDEPPYKDKIERIVSNLIDCVHREEWDTFKQILIEIAANLVSSAFHKQEEDTVSYLGILWLFEQYKLIVDICDKFNKKYNQYQSALLHAAALFPSGEKKLSKVDEICSCIEEKDAGKKYKAQVGLSYIYYRIWSELEDKPILMSLLTPETQQNIKKRKNFELILKAKSNAINSYTWLKKNRLKAENKIYYRTKKYYYSINNLLYFITLIGSKQEFNKNSTIELYDSLYSIIGDETYWQSRYHDTLALFFFRKALESSNRNEFKVYINDAISHNQQAITNIKIGSSIKEYQRFGHKIKEVNVAGFDKLKKS